MDSKPPEGSRIYPRETTQYGISETLCVSRGYVSQQLRLLLDSGLLHSSVQRVVGGRKKMRIYIPTLAGEAEAGRLLEEMGDAFFRRPPGNGGNGDLMSKLIEIVHRSGRGGN